jgi:hypothetical protein
MKIITISDLHGSSVWKKIDPSEWDHLVFVGDYVDSDDFTPGQIKKNLKSILHLKKKYPHKVVLLMGNHDLAYYYGGKDLHLGSGFDEKMLHRLYSVFKSEEKNFQSAFQIGNYLWTHAGVVDRWHGKFIRKKILSSDENLAYTLNRLFREYYLPLFHVSAIRGGINDDGGIFWAHSTETREDPLQGYHQIVGHTKTRNGIITSGHPTKGTSVTYVDCLDTSVEFHKLALP